jgi:hypothetical protein
MTYIHEMAVNHTSSSTIRTKLKMVRLWLVTECSIKTVLFLKCYIKLANFVMFTVNNNDKVLGILFKSTCDMHFGKEVLLQA